MDKRDLTKAELEAFGKSLWPAKTVDDVAELKELLDCTFFEYGDDHNEEVERGDTDEQWKNFSAYCRKVGGFAWINALHPFYGPGEPLDTALTYLVKGDPDEWRFVSFLLQMGADPNVRDGQGQPPLFIFINHFSPMRRYRVFDLLMESGANDKAVYGGKTMVQVAKNLKDNDKISEMVWDDFKRKHGIMYDDSGEESSDTNDEDKMGD